MLKFTDNILLDQNLIKAASILANNPDEPFKELYSFEWNNNTDEMKNYSGYDLMGVSFEINTKLNQFDLKQGTYGLKFSFESDKNIHELLFGISDMNGNVYRFDTFVPQQKLFDISNLQNIKRLTITLYQDNNFMTFDNELIPYMIEGDPILGIKESKMNNNIIIQNLQVFLGYNIEDFDGDIIEISTPGYLSYNKIDRATELNAGKKELNLRWVHDNKDGTYKIFTKDDIKTEGLQIYWWKYTLNQTTDDWKELAGGPNWTPLAQDTFSTSFQPNYSKATEKIKCTCRLPNAYGSFDEYNSSILTFENELSVIDTTTYNAAAVGLQIVCMDKSEGNYFIYDTSSNIINEGEGQGFTRRFEVRYNNLPLNDESSNLGEIQEIEWRLPKDSSSRNTMLSYSSNYLMGDVYDDHDPALHIIKYNKNITYEQSYSIKNNWQSSNSWNTVECWVTADGNIYKTTLDLQFGKAGTSGTNVTLVLDFENNENAFVLNDAGKADKDIYVKALMYDTSGKLISNPSGTWSWGWLHDNIEQYITIKSTGDDTSSRIQLTLTSNSGIIVPKNNYCILKAIFTPSAESEYSAKVESYLPIPIKRKGYGYIEGCRKVVFNSQGTPEYYSDAYLLYDNDQQEIIPKDSNLKWKLNIENGSNDIQIDWELDDNEKEKIILTNAPNNYSWFTFKNLTRNNRIYPALSSSPIYIKDYNNKICLTASIGNTTVWSQPILIIQSQYDYATLNAWNGTLTIDEDKNQILTAMIGSGRKDSNNTFSGILMGEIGINEKNKEVGLYGISKGIQSFSLTETGVATFGGEGQGKVIIGLEDSIDGVVNTITSANGELYMDIDYGSLNFKYNNGLESLSIGNFNKQNNNYLKFTSSAGNTLLDFSKDNYIIQAVDPSKLKIDLKNGTLTSSSLSSSSFNCTNVICNSLAAGSGTAYLGTTASNGYCINFGNFKVAADGTVYYKGTELGAYIKSLIPETT